MRQQEQTKMSGFLYTWKVKAFKEVKLGEVWFNAHFNPITLGYMERIWTTES